MSFIDPLWNSLLQALTPYAARPASTLFITAIALGLSLATNVTNRLLVDVNKLKAARREVTAWRAEFNKARKMNDKKLLDRVMKRQASITKLQSRMALDQMKVSFVFFIPFLGIFSLLSSFYGNQVVAFSPFEVPYLLTHELPFVSWYILASFATSLPIAKLLGTSPDEGR